MCVLVIKNLPIQNTIYIIKAVTVNLPKQEEKTFCRTAERSVSGLMHPALKWLWDYEFEIRKQEKLPCILAHIFSFFLPFVILTSMISSSQVCICLEASLKSVSFVATGLHAFTYELPFYSKTLARKIIHVSSSIMWTRDSRYGFWCLPIDILLQRSNAAFFTYMLTGYQTKTRYRRFIKCL